MSAKVIVYALVAAVAVSCSSKSVWEKTLEQYSSSEMVNQLLFVKCTQGSEAVAEFYVKDCDGGWQLDRKGAAYIGKNGLGKTREGDGMSPDGDFGIRSAFGILPDPGTSFTYIQVLPSTFACDEEGEYYNQIIDTVFTGHSCHGEDMSAIVPAYNYGLQTDYNPQNIYPLGSAIFIHCKGDSPYTGGCVALDEDFMLHILKNADPALRICIHSISD